MLKFVYDISSLFKKYKYLSICKKLPVRIILGCFVYKETFNTNLYQEVKIRTILTKSLITVLRVKSSVESLGCFDDVIGLF